jgi:hypothetical protein
MFGEFRPATPRKTMQPAHMRRWLVAALLALAGCGGSGSPKTCYPVSGELFVAGQPAGGAVIFFQPQDGSRPEEWTAGFPRAVVQSDGKFQVSTYETDDGAPAGDYVLLVQWRPAGSEDSESEAAPEGQTTDRLGGKYMNPATSQLRATVGQAPTPLPRMDLQ